MFSAVNCGPLVHIIKEKHFKIRIYLDSFIKLTKLRETDIAMLPLAVNKRWHLIISKLFLPHKRLGNVEAVLTQEWRLR